MNESTQFQDDDFARLTQLRTCLDAARVTYQILVHAQNLSSAEDGAQTGLGALSEMAPTFILKTESGYLAAIVRGDTRLSYKKIKQKLGLKNVSLAAPEQVKQLTGSEIGYVALVNHGLKTIVDQRVTQIEMIYGGSGESGHTLKVSPQAVIALTQAQVFDFTELKEKASIQAEKAEMLQDIQDYDSAKAALERGDEELIPGEVIDAILDGENAIKVWREYRGMSSNSPERQT
jgi:prolyl-tRNA editing enzyme YbaK/EbsC (Cys-tRNA(Pro) deacylase)